MSAVGGLDECPTGCGDTVAPGRLMCFACWGNVPKHLQREVNRAWRAINGLGFGNCDALAAYDRARAAAIGAIR